MAKMLICYHSKTSHTEHMAQAVAEGAREVRGLDVEVLSVESVRAERLIDYDAIVVGSPTWYGSMSAEIKRLFDESICLHGRLEGKVGGAFTSSANIGGGNETTIMDILKAMLIHGMIIPGTHKGDHYGPVAIGDVDDRSLTQCRALGKRCGQLAVRLVD